MGQGAKGLRLEISMNRVVYTNAGIEPATL